MRKEREREKGRLTRNHINIKVINGTVTRKI